MRVYRMRAVLDGKLYVERKAWRRDASDGIAFVTTTILDYLN